MSSGSSIVSRGGHVASVLGLVAAGAAASPAAAQPVPPVRLSVSTSGTQANGASQLLDQTPDGRVVLLVSQASNLVDGDTNDTYDLFVRDRDVDRDGVFDEPGAVATIRVSRNPANGRSGYIAVVGNPRLSRDGRFVYFDTLSVLDAADTNGSPDGYLYDRDADGNGVFDDPGGSALSLVTTGSGNALAVGGASSVIDLSTDGRYVLFASNATNLSAQPTTTARIYRKDRLTSVTVLVSSLPDGTPVDVRQSAAMSPDGRYVVLAASGEFVEPTVPPTGAARWVLRDLDENRFVPITQPDRPATGLPVSAPYTFQVAGVSGFSPDGRFAYLGDLTFGTGGQTGVSGSTFEYDVAANRITRRLPAVTPDGGTLDARDGRGFTLIRGSNIFFGTRDASRYVPATGRFTTTVAGQVCEFDSAGGRSLYRAGQCTEPPLYLDDRYGVPLPMPPPVLPGRLDAAGSLVIFTSSLADILPGGADTNGVSDVFAVDLVSRFDRDGDGLDDRWEIAMGLDYTSGAGADGAAGDPDGDGLTNLQEQTAGSHPRGGVLAYLAEGADNAFFRTRIALANPGAAATTAVLRFDGDDGGARSINVHVPAGARRTVFLDEVSGRSPSFSTVVDAPAPLVVERTMSWDATEYGAHAERAAGAPATHWFLAEGATGAFSLFYLLQNPGGAAATATIRFLRPAPLAPIERSYTLPPHSRTTLPVDQQAPELASTDVSAAITSTQPILVERAMYRSVPGQPFAAGDDSAGVTSDSTTWFLAEGATGPFFDLFVLLANPNPTDANVEIRYLLPDGTVLTKTYVVAASSRRTIYVDQESIPGHGQPFVNVAVSCAITSTNGVPIVAERTMWFPGPEITPTSGRKPTTRPARPRRRDAGCSPTARPAVRRRRRPTSSLPTRPRRRARPA